MKIGLLGFGVVGRGVYELTRGRDDMQVVKVLRREDMQLPDAKTVRDIRDIVEDDSIDTVVEVMGGLHPAYDYVRAAIEAGKNVVTANKALVCTFYDELLPLVQEKGVCFRCTAAVGGGIGWLSELERARRVQSIREVGGIMNGTCNYILDNMTRQGLNYDDVLKQAQALGYAEADPSADIDGDDIRRKLCISANIAFDAVLDETAIPTFGIRTVTAADIAAFTSHGFVCRLLAAAEAAENGVCAYVEPTLVAASELEASVPANYNLISYTAEGVGRQSFFGQGAGRFPTAGNVVQDCLTILAGDKSFYTDKAVPAALDGSAEAHPYYVRTAAPDDFLRSVTVDTWGSGIVTAACNSYEMLAWAKRQLAADPACFIAGIR